MFYLRVVLSLHHFVSRIITVNASTKRVAPSVSD